MGKSPYVMQLNVNTICPTGTTRPALACPILHHTSIDGGRLTFTLKEPTNGLVLDASAVNSVASTFDTLPVIQARPERPQMVGTILRECSRN